MGTKLAVIVGAGEASADPAGVVADPVREHAIKLAVTKGNVISIKWLFELRFLKNMRWILLRPF